ncbi:hypothetical protein HAX54_028393 [Datura stramonium]|uniref:Uncharacterized protein n=1 Tax=Datura stramonium TaxID=4076 RepID=A0ABS8V6C9_DATST|nr:hypothetical protein [Datura stramonium]
MPTSILQNPDNWNLIFLIKNPSNDHIFFYDDFDAKITYNETILWQANASAKFYQDEKAQNYIDATSGALPEIYGDRIIDTILNELASGHSTKFSGLQEDTNVYNLHNYLDLQSVLE